MTDEYDHHQSELAASIADDRRMRSELEARLADARRLVAELEELLAQDSPSASQPAAGRNADEAPPTT
jgi:hypothetical protein